MEVNEKAGLNFPKACRALLRQDPDIILIGEIRDQETAKMAIQSALAGTLLLSSIHAKNAISTIDRIISLGVERFWASSAISAIIAQRLIRKLCPYCKVEVKSTRQEQALFQLPKNSTLYQKTGCKVCHGSGYLGRECLAELLPITSELEQGINDAWSPQKIDAYAKKAGMIRFLEEAKKKLLAGTTTVTEIAHVLGIPLC